MNLEKRVRKKHEEQSALARSDLFVIELCREEANDNYLESEFVDGRLGVSDAAEGVDVLAESRVYNGALDVAQRGGDRRVSAVQTCRFAHRHTVDACEQRVEGERNLPKFTHFSWLKLIPPRHSHSHKTYTNCMSLWIASISNMTLFSYSFVHEIIRIIKFYPIFNGEYSLFTTSSSCLDIKFGQQTTNWVIGIQDLLLYPR